MVCDKVMSTFCVLGKGGKFSAWFLEVFVVEKIFKVCYYIIYVTKYIGRQGKDAALNFNLRSFD